MKKYNVKKMIGSILFAIGIAQVICMPLEAVSAKRAEAKLTTIHSKVHLVHGSLTEEYPEQLMAAMYISKKAKVLELGGNVGRNSCVIASILKNSHNLVVVESSLESAKLLQENRDANGLEFQIESSAISKVPLIQNGWKTIPSATEIPGYTRVKTISFKKLKKKYGIKFDTLVVDCEGALYKILVDEPEMLKNIHTIIIENDFDNLDELFYVQNLFRQNGLDLVYNQPGGFAPCYDYFYQVWKK